MAAAEVHGDIVLHVSDEKLYFEPVNSPRDLLIIDRLTNAITVEVNKGQIPSGLSTRAIYGIYGSFRCFAGPCVIVITKRSKVGDIDRNVIWRVDGTEIISFAKSNLHLTEQQALDDGALVAMIQAVLDTPHHYFSYTYDLTHSLQKLASVVPEFRRTSLYERADDRFVWNRQMLNEFTGGRHDLFKYALPVVHGFMTIQFCSVNGKSFNWSVLSRRSSYNAGTRFYSRGINTDGQVANFVETEQIIEYDGQRAAFIQTRGSIPLFWNQLPNLKYKPKPTVDRLQDHVTAFARHFQEQILHYGQQVLVNLVDQKGSEGKLEKSYCSMVENFGNELVKYEAFDFHHECRQMRWDRLSILMDRLTEDFEEHGYLHLSSDGIVIRSQNGVFRTNCIDCLDRTNVVQSMLAHRNVEVVLERLGVLQNGAELVNHAGFECKFKNVWADNADYVSVQYSGTGALKTDYTRTGKRTKMGALKDGANSLMRYYKNNFADGFRQDAIDFFLGHWTVDGGGPSLMRRERDWKYFLPLTLLLSFAMWASTILLPDEYSTEVVLFMLFWAFAFMSSLYTIISYGPEFVDKPKLVDRHKWPR